MDYVDIELMAVVAAALVVVTLDGRCNRSPRATKYTFPNTTWKNVQASNTSDGWYKRELRMNRRYSFYFIVSMVTAKWELLHPPIKLNSKITIKDKVAISVEQ